MSRTRKQSCEERRIKKQMKDQRKCYNNGMIMSLPGIEIMEEEKNEQRIDNE